MWELHSDLQIEGYKSLSDFSGDAQLVRAALGIEPRQAPPESQAAVDRNWCVEGRLLQSGADFSSPSSFLRFLFFLGEGFETDQTIQGPPGCEAE